MIDNVLIRIVLIATDQDNKEGYRFLFRAENVGEGVSFVSLPEATSVNPSPDKDIEVFGDVIRCDGKKLIVKIGGLAVTRPYIYSLDSGQQVLLLAFHCRASGPSPPGGVWLSLPEVREAIGASATSDRSLMAENGEKQYWWKPAPPDHASVLLDILAAAAKRSSTTTALQEMALDAVTEIAVL